jgi:hypothetical protein
MASIGYLDIGALQHKDSGSPGVNTGYPDIGAVQHETAAVATFKAAWLPQTPKVISPGVR